MLKSLKITYHLLRALWLSPFNRNFTFGVDFKFYKSCEVSRKNSIQIGDRFYMGKGCFLSSDLIIGNDVMFASEVACVGGDHQIDNIETTLNTSGRDILKTTIIEDNVWIGHGVIILHGVVIRSGAVVAAGSVVTKSIPKNSIYGGNPAKFIRFREPYS